MKALVVGGNGFIGSHLVDGLAWMGWDVVVLDLHDRRFDALPTGARFIRGDAGDSYAVREALNGVDIVYHLAWTTIHETANRDPVADIQSNLVTSVHLMKACLQAQVARFVFLSSGGTVYGPVKELPTPESHPLEPITAYGITKLAVEKYLKLFHRLEGLDYVVLRPSVPYGPRQNPLGRQGAAAVFLHRISHHLPISLFGDGSLSRDFFYIRDLVQAMTLSATAELDGRRIFNIGGGVEITLNQLIQEIERIIGRRAILDQRPARPYDVPRILLDTTFARDDLGWSIATDLPTGLSRTWEWMQAEFD